LSFVPFPFDAKDIDSFQRLTVVVTEVSMYQKKQYKMKRHLEKLTKL